MAIARGAGTEIIRSAHFEAVSDSGTILIYGEQHHIYTVLSVIAYCDAIAAAGNPFYMYITGYDSKAGTTAQECRMLKTPIQAAGDTFVFNDKFSFNGAEPTNFTGPMDDATKQNAIADQAEGGVVVAQKLGCMSHHGSDSYEVFVTYIDQNNA